MQGQHNLIILEKPDNTENFLFLHDTLRRFAELLNNDREKLNAIFQTSRIRNEKTVGKILDSLLLTLTADIVVPMDLINQFLECSTAKDIEDLLKMRGNTNICENKKAIRRKRGC